MYRAWLRLKQLAGGEACIIAAESSQSVPAATTSMGRLSMNKRSCFGTCIHNVECYLNRLINRRLTFPERLNESIKGAGDERRNEFHSNTQTD